MSIEITFVTSRHNKIYWLSYTIESLSLTQIFIRWFSR